MRPAAKLAFLVLGPMLDFKLYFMYTRVFQTRLIWTIFLSVIVQVFVYSYAVHMIWERYRRPCFSLLRRRSLAGVANRRPGTDQLLLSENFMAHDHHHGDPGAFSTRNNSSPSARACAFAGGAADRSGDTAACSRYMLAAEVPHLGLCSAAYACSPWRSQRRRRLVLRRRSQSRAG